jgi:hypothetical protein
MRAILLAALAVPAVLWASAPAFGEEPQAAVEPPPAEQPATDAAVAATKAAEQDKLHLPPGFKVKKRGKFTLYCRTEEVMGTRFPVEKCYDEKGIRDYVLDQRENQKQVDQMRRICGSMESCGGGG